MGKVLLILMLAGLGWVTAAGAEEKPLPPERQLIARIVDAYGGEKALAKVGSVFAEGHIDAFMQKDEGTSVRYLKRPRKLRAELTYGRFAETRLLDGTHGWRRSSNKPFAEVIGPPFLGMVYQYKYLDLPFAFLDNAYTVTLLPREKLHGADVDVLLLADAEGPPMRVYVDAMTHLIVKVVGTFSIGTVSTELAAEFSQFQTVEGVRFPFKITNYGGDNKIAETIIKEIRLNREMPEALFRP